MHRTKPIFTIIATAILFGLMRTASAADYYLAYFSDEPKHSWVVLIDPSSITTTNGIATARSLIVHSNDLWRDETVQYNCSGKQYKTMTSLAHMGSGAVIDRSSLPDVGTWQSISPNSLDELMLTQVCNWSSSKMVGNAIYSAPDWNAAAHGISELLFKIDQGAN